MAPLFQFDATQVVPGTIDMHEAIVGISRQAFRGGTPGKRVRPHTASAVRGGNTTATGRPSITTTTSRRRPSSAKTVRDARPGSAASLRRGSRPASAASGRSGGKPSRPSSAQVTRPSLFRVEESPAVKPWSAHEHWRPGASYAA